MAKKKMTEKHKLACYVLHKEFGRTQTKIADLFDVKQSTVSNAIKDATAMIAIKNMIKELEEVRNELSQYKQPANLLEDKNVIDI